jgi:hypothetical protein
MADRLPFWSDNFDMDLLKVFPDAVELCDHMEDLKLWTYSHTTLGRINCPSSWNTDLGLMAFFWTKIPAHHREGNWSRFGFFYTTDAPLVECTWLEVIRDEWSHQSVVNVNGLIVWRPGDLWPHFERIMWFVRDVTKTRDATTEQVQAALQAAVQDRHREISESLLRCRKSIEKATENLVRALAKGEARG